MPSPTHETPIELVRLDPSLRDWVQTLLGDDTPAFDQARLYDPNVRPRTYQADAMVLLCGSDGAPVRAGDATDGGQADRGGPGPDGRSS